MSILLLTIVLLSSCKTPIISGCQIPLQRLTIINVDCKGKTYGDCIIEYNSALKQSNKDKQAIIELTKEKK